jgi:hypothetical protein
MKPIPSAPGYFACENGYVWRNGTRRLETTNGRGYHRITLSINGDRRDSYAHRLVCEAYHGPCPTGLECRHLDGNRSNNKPGNLQWATRRENEAAKVGHGTLMRGETHYAAQLTDEIVIEARRRVARGEPLEDVSRSFGLSRIVLGCAVRGDTWKHLPGAIVARHRFRKFTADQVREIRSSQLSQSELGRRHRVNKNAIAAIQNRETYRDIP